MQQIIQKDKNDILSKSFKLSKHLGILEKKELVTVNLIPQRRYFVKNNQPKIKARNEARKKHHRRTALEIDRD